MNILRVLNTILSKYITLWIVGLSAIACIVPSYFTWAISYTALFLGVAMFGMGLTIKMDDVIGIIQRPKHIAIGVLAQYTIMPLGAWILCHLFSLPPDIAIGVILVGCCPGGTASNVITYIADGDVPLSVGMTIASTLLAPLVTPLLIWYLGGTWVDVALVPMMITVVKVIVLPIALGILVQVVGKDHMHRIAPISPVLSMVAIIVIIAAIIAINRDKIAVAGLLTLGVVCLHNLFGITMGLLISRLCHLNHKQSTALAIEVGMQNSGLAVTLAAVNFAMNPLATLVGALFSVWHNVSGAFFASLRRKQSDEAVPYESEAVDCIAK